MARGVTTEWEDIHVARGNWKAREHVATSEEIFQTQQEQVENYDQWKGLNKQQLDEMVEDDLDLEDDDFMKQYQAQRLNEMKEQAAQFKFSGGLYEISKNEYEWHVKNMPQETLGVILMY
jgi:molecular chaperone DnaK (HSP70)